jgi:N6-adenosine-specific RNA methylase IME4
MSHPGVRDNEETVYNGIPHVTKSPGEDLLSYIGDERFATILADPPWRFNNRTGKVAPEHKRLSRYGTMSLGDIRELPVSQITLPQSHLYLWVPNALILEGLRVMEHWGFTYKTNLVWYKIRKDGGPDGRGVGFYFRNVTELVLFGVRGKMRTLRPGRRQVNLLASRHLQSRTHQCTSAKQQASGNRRRIVIAAPNHFPCQPFCAATEVMLCPCT